MRKAFAIILFFNLCFVTHSASHNIWLKKLFDEVKPRNTFIWTNVQNIDNKTDILYYQTILKY